MHKVLVIEDEKLVRSHVVYHVTRCGLNFQWIMEAESAEEALEMIRENPPDIIITDIMMGEMSGLDLIRAVHEMNSRIVTVILCGHPSFSFAREAIELNVISYLLKPVNPDELTESLQKAALQLLNQNTMQILAAKNDVLLKKLEDSSLHSEIYSFLNGFQNDSSVTLSGLFAKNMQYYQIAVLHINGGWTSVVDDVKREDTQLMRYGAINILNELEEGQGIAFQDLENEKQIVVIMGSSESDAKKAQSELNRRVRILHDKIINNLDIGLFVGVSNICESLSVMGLDEAKRALDLRFCFSHKQAGRVFNFNEYDSGDNTIELDTKQYQAHLDSGDSTNAIKLVRNAFEGCVDKPAINIRLIYIEAVCILARSCFKNGVSVFTLLGSEMINGSVINRYESLTQVVDGLCDTIEAAMGEWVGDTAEIGAILDRIKRYIEEHYCEAELCTNELATRFCISLGYLSASYRKMYATTISKYIIELRMNHVKELLLTTNLPVHQIAENSGYNHLSYFMRVFKKFYGCTCSQFREKKAE